MTRSWFKSLLVFCVLTVWSVATVHCGVEAAGMLAHHENLATVESDGCCEPVEDCSRDACGIVEDAEFSQPSADAKVPAPQLMVERCLSCLNAALAERPELETPAVAFATDRHPPTWIPERHALRRAAPPARAPAAKV